jgi:hypothetical protein
MVKYFFLITISFLFGIKFSNAQSSNDWVFKKVAGSKLLFKNGKNLETKLFELKYIGQIPTKNSAPYFIFSGRDCNECDENISIYVHSPSNGNLRVENGGNRYRYPGTEKDYATGKIVYNTRAFYGQILKGLFGIIWYQKELTDDGKMKPSVFFCQIENGTKKEIPSFKGNLSETVDLMKRGDCTEIQGLNFTSEP